MSESTQDVLAAAVARLDDLVNETVATGKVSNELIKVALAMVAPTLRLLRYDVRMFETCTSDETRERVERASEQAGDLAIAQAVLGRSHERPNASSEGASK